MNETLRNCQFTYLNENEMLLIDGGGSLGKAFAGVGACLLIAAGGISVIVGAGVAVGTGGAAVGPGVGVACAGVDAIVAGSAILTTLF